MPDRTDHDKRPDDAVKVPDEATEASLEKLRQELCPYPVHLLDEAGKASWKEGNVNQFLGLLGLVGTLKAKGLLDEAIQLATHASELALSVFGDVHPSRAACLHELGTALNERGDYDEAIHCLEQALKLRRDTLPSPHWDTAATLIQLGQALGARAEATGADETLLRQADQHLNEALAMLSEVEQSRPEYRLIALRNLGLVQARLGHMFEAGDFLDAAYEIAVNELPWHHPNTASLLAGMVRVERAADRGWNAVQLLKQVSEIRKVVLAPGNPILTQTFLELARLGKQLGELSLVHEALDELRRIEKELLPPHHRHRAQILIELGRLYRQMNDPYEADQCHQEARSVLEVAVRDDHPLWEALNASLAGATRSDDSAEVEHTEWRKEEFED